MARLCSADLRRPKLTCRRRCASVLEIAEPTCGVCSPVWRKEAVAWVRRSVEINRSFPGAHFLLADTLARPGGSQKRDPKCRKDLQSSQSSRSPPKAGAPLTPQPVEIEALKIGDRHRIVPRDPVVGLFLRIGIRSGIDFGFISSSLCRRIAFLLVITSLLPSRSWIVRSDKRLSKGQRSGGGRQSGRSLPRSAKPL
jgi:hypothetical protein